MNAPHCTGPCFQGRKSCRCQTGAIEVAAPFPAEACTEIGLHTAAPRRGLLDRFKVRVRRWWQLRQATERLLGLHALCSQCEEDLKELRKRKTGAGWAKTPTLDAQIRATNAELDKSEKELADTALLIDVLKALR